MRLLFLLIFAPFFLIASSPLAIYLIAGDDPTTSVRVRWIAKGSDPDFLKSQNAKHQAVISYVGVEDLFLFAVDLEGLSPGKGYDFHIGNEKPTYTFHTCPEGGEEELRIAVAGDIFSFLSPFKQITEAMREKSPHLLILGGDLAYTHSRPSAHPSREWELKRWLTFFQVLARGGKKNELIPLAVVPGNHDVGNEGVPFVAELFLLREKSFRVLTLPSLSFFLLDSGHIHPIEGEQRQWLEGALKQHEGSPFKFAAYHIAAYPSVYEFEGEKPKQLRAAWVPLFEESHLQAAFEHHNHAYKRTFPLKENKIDPTGVVYLGDGASGVRTRKPKSRDYLAAKGKENNFWLIRLQKNVCTIESFDDSGKIMEKLKSSPFSPLELEMSNTKHLK